MLSTEPEAPNSESSPGSPLSREFRRRIEAWSDSDVWRVILVLARESVGPDAAPSERHPSGNRRRQSFDEIVGAIDTLLARHGGRRLQATPSALGTLTIEATKPAILALSDLKDVLAILEDQPIGLNR